MTKKELIDTLAARTGLTKLAVGALLDEQVKLAKETLANGRTFEIHGLVKIARQPRASRTGRNPITGEPIQIHAKVVAKATASKSLMGAQ